MQLTGGFCLLEDLDRTGSFWKMEIYFPNPIKTTNKKMSTLYISGVLYGVGMCFGITLIMTTNFYLAKGWGFTWSMRLIYLISIMDICYYHLKIIQLNGILFLRILIFIFKELVPEVHAGYKRVSRWSFTSAV